MNYKQDLFYGNIPYYNKRRLVSNLGYLKQSLVEKSFLKETNNPYFIWTGTGRIRKLEQLQLTIKTLNKIRKSKLQCDFYLYEPMCTRIDSFNQSFYSEFTAGTDLSQIISDEIESIKIFTQNNNIDKLRIFTCDYNIQKIQNNYPGLSLSCLDLFIRELSIYRYVKNFEKKIIEKKFWCGNWRYTPHRHLIMSYLVNIDSGIYSWNLKCSFEDLKKNIWFDLDKYQITDSKRFGLIRKGVDTLNSKVYSIDTNIDQVEVKNYSAVYIPGHNAPPRSEDFLSSYKKCFCAVVNETRFAQPFGNFSEKTLDSIASLSPFVLVAPPKTLEYLRVLGFKTFNNWWDESYDQEEDHEKRLIKIFDVIDFINNRSLEELKMIYEEMQPILEHNISILEAMPYNKDFL